MSRLHHAIRTSSEPQVLRLIKDGLARADETSPDGEPAIHAACRRGYALVVQELLQMGAPAGGPDRLGRDPMHLVAMGTQVDLVDLLLIRGGTVNCVDNHGGTPLHAAARSGSVPMLKMLISRGAKMSARDFAGQAPLHHAAIAGNEQIIEVLIAGKAVVDVRDAKGNTPLHLAAANGRERAVRALLKAGAEKAAVNQERKRPYDLATGPQMGGGQFDLFGGGLFGGLSEMQQLLK